jgi:hypothetical protein
MDFKNIFEHIGNEINYIESHTKRIQFLKLSINSIIVILNLFVSSFVYMVQFKEQIKEYIDIMKSVGIVPFIIIILFVFLNYFNPFVKLHVNEIRKRKYNKLHSTINEFVNTNNISLEDKINRKIKKCEIDNYELLKIIV